MSHKSFEEREKNDIWAGLPCYASVRYEYHRILSVISLTGDFSTTTKQSGWNTPRQTPEAKIALLARNASFAWREKREPM